MARRRKNPSAKQWTVIVVASAAAVGVGAAVYAATRKSPKGPIRVSNPIPAPEPLPWQVVTAADPGYPWEFPALHYENIPTPGTWFDAGDFSGAFDSRHGFDAMVRAMLRNALAMAGNDPWIADAEGRHPNAGLGRSLRRQARRLVAAPGGINDLLYGQTNLNYAGGNDPLSPGGDTSRPRSDEYLLSRVHRGLNWRPVHADNLDRIQAGLAPKRTTSATGEPLAGPHAGCSHMLIWLPAVDLAALVPGRQPMIRPLLWSDGSSTEAPPPVIARLGVDMSGVNLQEAA